MKLFPLILTCCVLVLGCAAPTVRVGVAEGYVGETARIVAVKRPSPLGVLAGEAFSGIKSVDGSPLAAEYIVLPGKHTLQLALTNMSYGYTGTFDTVIVGPESYELSATRSGDRFEILFIRVSDGNVVARGTVTATSFTPVYVPILIKK